MSTAQKQTFNRAAIFLEAQNAYHKGKLQDAQDLCKKMLETNPKDPEVLGLCGVIALAYDNDLIALLYFNEAIKYAPKSVPLIVGLAMSFRVQKDYKSANTCIDQAIRFDPTNEQALVEQAKIIGQQDPEEGVKRFNTLMERNVKIPSFDANMAIMQHMIGNIDEAYKHALKALDDSLGLFAVVHAIMHHHFLARDKAALLKFADTLRAKGYPEEKLGSLYVRAAVLEYMSDYKDTGTWVEMQVLLDGAKSIEAAAKKSTRDYRNDYTYYLFLIFLLSYRQNESQCNYSTKQAWNGKHLYVIGDSHCLSPSLTTLDIAGESYLCNSELVIGAKAFTLGNNKKNEYKTAFCKVLDSIPRASKVVLMFGEIDTRPDEGITKHFLKNPCEPHELTARIEKLASDYLDYTAKQCAERGIMPAYYGVPPRSRGYKALKTFSKEFIALNLSIIKLFNEALQRLCAERSLGFIDVYSLIRDEQHLAKLDYHVDQIHLKPHVFQQAIIDSLQKGLLKTI